MANTRNQDGFALIEVIVSAAVLAIVALAVLSGIDGATASTSRERARAIAGSLAEKDQERLRSYRFDSLATVPQANPVTIDGVTYTVKSEASWVTDNVDATPACGDSSTKQAEYLRIVSTVTSNIVGTRIAPVTIESLVAPTVTYAQGHGTLAVRVVDRTGETGVAGISVGAKTATKTLTPATTNSAGCALFRSIDVGNYTLTLNTPGYIGKSGAQLVTATTSVVPNYLNVAEMQYDKAVTMKIDVRSLKPGEAFTSTSTGYASKAMSVSDAAAQASVLRTFTPVAPNTTATTFNSPKLFPFDKSPYSYFTGDCGYLSPTKAADVTTSPYSAYFTSINTRAAVQGDPNALQSQPATVFQPALNVRLLTDRTGTTLTSTSSSITVSAKLVKPSKQSADTCVSDYTTAQTLDLKDWPTAVYGATLPSGAAAGLNFVSQPGSDFDPGLPFGTYTLCFQNGTKYYNYTGTGLNTGLDQKGYDNVDPSGRSSTLKLAPNSSAWKSGTCPA